MPYNEIGHDHRNSMQIFLHPLWRRYVGLWQTSVLSLDLAEPAGGLRQQVSTPVINFLFGDASSARTQVDVPYNQRLALPVFSAIDPSRPAYGCPKLFVHKSPVMACAWSIDDATGSMPSQQTLFLCRYEDVHVGESAELLLLSNTPDFSSFKVGHAWLCQCSC